MRSSASPRPLADSDDREAFDCGQETLNYWFRRHALANHRNDVSRVTVLSDSMTGRVIGFVTLSSTHIERAFLPKAHQRNRPDPVPVTLLGQLAIDLVYQGQGHAKSLLVFALRTALASAEGVGSSGVLTHPLDDGLRRFYRRWGFVDLPYDPRKAMLVSMAEVRSEFSVPQEQPG